MIWDEESLWNSMILLSKPSKVSDTMKTYVSKLHLVESLRTAHC